MMMYRNHAALYQQSLPYALCAWVIYGFNTELGTHSVYGNARCVYSHIVDKIMTNSKLSLQGNINFCRFLDS